MKISKYNLFYLVLVVLVISFALVGCNKEENNAKKTESKLTVKHIKLEKNKVDPILASTIYETKKIMIVAGIHDGILIYDKEKHRITSFVNFKDGDKVIPINAQNDYSYTAFSNKGGSKIEVFNSVEPVKYKYIYDVKKDKLKKVESTYTQKDLEKLEEKNYKLRKRWHMRVDVKSTPSALEYHSPLDRKVYKPFS